MPQLARALVEVQTAMDYFQLLSLALNDPTMTKRTDSLKEVETLTRLARIGLMEGNLFDPAVLDKATRDAMEAGFEAGKQTVKAAVRDGMIRITSYNVCYTKLLRTMKLLTV